MGVTALSIATTKTSLGFGQAVALGALCNALVCLAIWLTYGAHTTADKILAIVPPIAAFVAVGFEHSVANMYFIPVGLLIERDTSWLPGDRRHSGHERPDVERVPRRQPDPRDDRKHDRRRASWSARSTGSSTCARAARSPVRRGPEPQTD